MSRRPIFLFSLPRSGSTVVQRVLASHREISTAPEPWLLLPFLYATRERGTFAEYGEVPAARAIHDFVERLPGGRSEYEGLLHDFVMSLYGGASSAQSTYFLDKTPRYHRVVDDIFRVFPDGKFLFLWRNPLAVTASIVDTWVGGRWSLGRWRQDLFGGLASLISAYEAYRDRSHAVRFEALISDQSDQSEAWRGIFEYLGLTFDPSSLSLPESTDPGGRMGDKVGTHRYAGLSSEPLDKWKRTLAGPLRIRWCREYLRWIGERRLAVMGYDSNELLRSLDALPRGRAIVVSDAIRMTYGEVTERRRDAAFRRLTKPGRW
jgi:hypothetical protein